MHEIVKVQLDQWMQISDIEVGIFITDHICTISWLLRYKKYFDETYSKLILWNMIL